ncbi:helix-turn-helix transcriptional regulator [Neobacillus sp. WH10]|uniref:helix-turn-helix transcriptional regulator n=1 Tax=Neobacillus sp. WH10 TaxID=3047873 RepID=UPI0024C10D84|nr:helix-turn-helix transcriptional regulator [Neobacillus sp. WH10]WHY76106.1 helix-turn-helix transcriptional regulator [Neobacillus sp. WH10]
MTLRLKELREKRGMTQTFLAKQLGYDYVSSYSMIEKGERKLDVFKAKKIADIFGVEIEDLFSEDDLAKKAN